MRYSELRKWLKERGCTFEPHKGGSGHITVRLGSKKTQLPAHGKGRDLGKGRVENIKKELGLK
jgi:mRNA interferase HicA